MEEDLVLADEVAATTEVEVSPAAVEEEETVDEVLEVEAAIEEEDVDVEAVVPKQAATSAT